MRPTNAEFKAAAQLIAARIDESRVPWLAGKRKPTKQERKIFIEWSASVPATGAVLTARRAQASSKQEAAIRAAAKGASYGEVTPPGTLSDPISQMPPGTYASASRTV